MAPEWIPPLLIIAAALFLCGLARLARYLLRNAPAREGEGEEEDYDPRDDWGYKPSPPRRGE